MPIEPSELSASIEPLLTDARIWDIDSYGWSGPDEIDDDFVGYAMWVLNPPYDEWAEDALPPTKKQQRLLEARNRFYWPHEGCQIFGWVSLASRR
jgi:hypothetical protein